MKKTFFIAFALFLFLFCAVASAQTLLPGQEFTASFTVTDNPNEATAAIIALDYDTTSFKLIHFEGDNNGKLALQDTTGIDVGKTITAVFKVQANAAYGEKTITARVENAARKGVGDVTGLVFSAYTLTVSDTIVPEMKEMQPRHEVFLGEAFLAKFTRNQPVYSGPGVDYFRAANGKAEYGSPEDLEVYGKEGNWILVCYWFGGSQRRMGYVLPNNDTKLIKPWDLDIPVLSFAYANAVIGKDCVLTDDPFRSMRTVSSLDKDTKITYLATLPEGHSDIDRNWAYVEIETEAMVNQHKETVLTRGFVPMDCVLFEH